MMVWGVWVWSMKVIRESVSGRLKLSGIGSLVEVSKVVGGMRDGVGVGPGRKREGWR